MSYTGHSFAQHAFVPDFEPLHSQKKKSVILYRLLVMGYVREEGIVSPRARVLGSFGSPDMDTRNLTQVLCKSNASSNHWDISPALGFMKISNVSREIFKLL